MRSPKPKSRLARRCASPLYAQHWTRSRAVESAPQWARRRAPRESRLARCATRCRDAVRMQAPSPRNGCVSYTEPDHLPFGGGQHSLRPSRRIHRTAFRDGSFEPGHHLDRRTRRHDQPRSRTHAPRPERSGPRAAETRHNPEFIHLRERRLGHLVRGQGQRVPATEWPDARTEPALAHVAARLGAKRPDGKLRPELRYRAARRHVSPQPLSGKASSAVPAPLSHLALSPVRIFR